MYSIIHVHVYIHVCTCTNHIMPYQWSQEVWDNAPLGNKNIYITNSSTITLRALDKSCHFWELKQMGVFMWH